MVLGHFNWFMQACASPYGRPCLKRGMSPLVLLFLSARFASWLNLAMYWSKFPSFIWRLWSLLSASSLSEVSVKASLNTSSNESQWYLLVSSIRFRVLFNLSSMIFIISWTQSWTCSPLMKVRARATQLVGIFMVLFFLFRNL